ncbi:MAG TPA: hypothetical protein VHE30_04755 [Polyangiaceae bacterium]|nr:hypothetical protein [Polyangiaceae bacterium]
MRIRSAPSALVTALAGVFVAGTAWAAATPAAPAATPAAPPPTAGPAPAPAASPAPAPTAEPAPASPPAKAPEPPSEPDPGRWKQAPAPVTETPPSDRWIPHADVGLDAGFALRPAKDATLVKYGDAWAVGAHVRVDVLSWLAARVHTRFEGQSVSFSDGALGLPSGTTYDMPSLHRVLLGFSAEPTWKPLPELSLWVGVGASWARTTAGTLHSHGAETVVVPVRSAVFVEYPFSAGARWELVPRFFAVSASGAVSILTDQSGNLLRPYDTPGADGKLRSVGGLPESGTSVTVLAGVSFLL